MGVAIINISKILSVALAFCIFANLRVAAAAENYALINSDGEQVNVSDWGNKQYVIKDRVWAIAIKSGSNDTDKLYINIADSFMSGKSGFSAKVTVEYYDEGTAGFALNYSSFDSEYKNSAEYGMKKTETVWLSGTNTWKTHTFEINDASYENKCMQNSDIFLSFEKGNGTSENVGIKSVKIERAYTAPVIFTAVSESYGNIFGTKQRFSLTLKNISNAACIPRVNYKIIDEDNNVVSSGSSTVAKLFGGDSRKMQLETETKKFGKYTLLLETATEYGGKTRTYSEKIPFSVINESAENELNERSQLSAHLALFGADGAEKELAETAKKAGFGGLRDEIKWDWVETGKKIYSLPEKPGKIPDLVTGMGLEQMLILAYGNPYYDNTEPSDLFIVPYTDEGIKGYADYCAYMARTFKGKVKYYEIWNEYNIKQFNAQERGADVYAKLLRAASAAIKAEDANAKIVAMATAGVATDFIKGVLDEGAGDCIDVISVHPYQYAGYSEQTMTDQIAELKKVIGGRNIPVWFTENGWTTCQNSWNSVSERQQAAFSIRSYALSQAKGLCERTYWYDIQNDGTDKNESEHNYGLLEAASGVRVPGAAKPAFIALAGTNKLLANAEYVSGIEKDGVYAFNFVRADGKNVAVLWADSAREIVLNLGAKEIGIHDMYSNVTGTQSKLSGTYKIAVGEEPVYVTGDFKAFAEGEEKDAGTLKLEVSPFYRDAECVFTLSVKNSYAKEFVGILNIEAIDADGNVKAAKSEPLSVPGSCEYAKAITAPITEAGEYILKVTFETEGESAAAQASYAVDNADDSFCNVSYENGLLKLSGKTDKPYKNVNVYAFGENAKYINSFESGSDALYDIQIPGICCEKLSVTVNDGKVHRTIVDAAAVHLYVGEKEIKELSDLKDGDVITASAVTDAQNVDFYVALYCGGKLKKVEKTEIKDGKAQINITAENVEAVTDIKCFLWEDMKPVAQRFYERG